MSLSLHRPAPIEWDVSQTQAFHGLMNQRIVFKSRMPAYPQLELPVHHISKFTSAFFNLWLKEHPSSIGSTPAHHFAGGPRPNDLDIQVVFWETVLPMGEKVLEDSIKRWLNTLIFQALPPQEITRELFNAYDCKIRPIPKKQGWVVDLNPDTQIVFKFPFQPLHGLSPLDGWKVSLQTGRLSVRVGDRIVTDIEEFAQLIHKVRRRDIEHSVIQDIRAVGRLYRILHYIGHGAKLCWEDVSQGLEEAFSSEMQKQYVRHLENHFPTLSSKIVDFLNFLTLIQKNPNRSKQVSHIVWTERERLVLGPAAYIALCIRSAPHLAPYFLRFIQGALFHDLASKNGSSSVKAWRLPFLDGEIRPFFLVKERRVCRYLAMDCPGIQKTPAVLVIEFLGAWEYLERELPKQRLHLKHLVHTFTALGLSPTLLSSSHRRQVIDEFAVETFRRFRHSSQVSPDGLRYIQSKLQKAAVLDVGFCVQTQDALLQSSASRMARKCYLKVISLMGARGQIFSLLHACLQQPHLYSIAFEASPHAGAISTEVRKKLCVALKDTQSKLVDGSKIFRKAWVKAAKEVGDAQIHQKCLEVLASSAFFKEDPFAILLQLQREIERSSKQSFKVLEKLQARKEAVLGLTDGAKELFRKIVLKILSASTASRVASKLSAFAREVQMLSPVQFQKTPISAPVPPQVPLEPPPKIVAKKQPPAPVAKTILPKVHSPIFGEVEIDEAHLSELFQGYVRDCLGEQALECVAIAEKHLPGKAFSSFKASIRAIVEKERSYPDVAFTELHYPQFISRTIELLPVYAHVCPKKGHLRIEGLILMDKFAKISMQFPDKISTLLSKAEALEPLKSSFTLAQWYNLHITAAKFYINNKDKINFDFISVHLKKAEYIIPRCFATASQRKAMIEVLQGLAITFLKKSLTDFTTIGNIFIEHVNERLIPYLKQDKYKADGFGAECARELFIHSCGIPAILTAVNNIEYTFEDYKENRLKFTYQKPENEEMLLKKLKEHGYDELLTPLKPHECRRLLSNALEAMTAEGSILESVLPRGKELLIYNLTFNTLNLYFELERDRYRPLMETKSLPGSQINDSINAHEMQLRQWAYYCYAVISGLNRKMFDLAMESFPFED